jgi:hypothetical protein
VRPLLCLIVAFWALSIATPTAGDPLRSHAQAASPSEVARAPSHSLIMVDDPACHYCRKWNKEVGGGYASTAEGRAAPLRRVRRDAKILSNFAPVIYTPTFILAQNGREIGRITGYPGQLYFWEELSTLLSTAGVDPKG